MTKLLSTREVAARIGVSVRKLEQMILRGEVPAHAWVGRSRKWRDDELQNWIENLFARDPQRSTNGVALNNQPDQEKPMTK